MVLARGGGLRMRIGGINEEISLYIHEQNAS